MTSKRTELALKYSAVLDFASHFKRMATPMLIDGEARLDKIGQGGERIALVYQERKVLIQADWTSLTVNVSGSRDDIFKSNGSARFFFDLAQRVSELEHFGAIRSIGLETFDIEYEKVPETTSAFAERALRGTAWIPADLLDIALTFEFKKKGVSSTINFGPYAGERDDTRHNLSLFGDDSSAQSNDPGILVRASTTNTDIHSGSELLSSFEELYHETKRRTRDCLRFIQSTEP